VNRRLVLVGGAGALLTGCGASRDGEDAAAPREPDPAADAEVLGGLLQLEQQAVALYRGQPGELFRTLEAHERRHAARLEEAIRRRGARPQRAGWMSEGGSPLDLARRVEETQVAAYREALPQITDGALRGVLATIVAAEAAHLAAVRAALDRPPAPDAFVRGRDVL
jgi:Ferritin-like domain